MTPSTIVTTYEEVERGLKPGSDLFAKAVAETAKRTDCTEREVKSVLIDAWSRKS